MAKIEEKDELTTYYENIYKDIEEQTNKDPFGNYIFQRVSGGTKTVFNKTQTEIRNFDMSFLDTIESVYPAIVIVLMFIFYVTKINANVYAIIPYKSFLGW